MKIALTGNPNSGKTTMYNALTGKNERVGNWAGVTVDKRESLIKKSYNKIEEDIVAVDLPGAYSMSPFTSEESITSAYVKNENPDVIINIVDATNLSRSLFFTTQLLELGIPVVVALNKIDVNLKKNNKIDIELLSQKLGCPVFETVSIPGKVKGLEKVIDAVISVRGKLQNPPYIQPPLNLDDKSAVEEADKLRFSFVNSIVEAVEKRTVFTNKKNMQDKIDAVITNKWVGLPVFALVMWIVFFVSQAWAGPWLADFVLCPVIDAFGNLVSGWMTGTSEILQTIVVDGIVGGVSAVIGFLPLVMVMYFRRFRVYGTCFGCFRPYIQKSGLIRKIGYSVYCRHRLCNSRRYGVQNYP